MSQNKKHDRLAHFNSERGERVLGKYEFDEAERRGIPKAPRRHCDREKKREREREKKRPSGLPFGFIHYLQRSPISAWPGDRFTRDVRDALNSYQYLTIRAAAFPETSSVRHIPSIPRCNMRATLQLRSLNMCVCVCVCVCVCARARVYVYINTILHNFYTTGEITTCR